jgi:lipopolysaccharide transport protein LptA
LRALALVAALSAVCAWGAALDPKQSFTWSADVLSSDFRNNTLELSGNVRVRQGPMLIEAEAATARNFDSEKSEWTFTRSVHIRTAEADLKSNSASATFVSGELAVARVEGSPAHFEQIGAAEERQVRGRAGLIEYDLKAGIVKLSDQVWFSNGKDEFRGDLVIYHVRDERVQINPGGQSQGRVRGIIRPRQDGTSSTQQEPPPPAEPKPPAPQAPARERGA